jgi:hypothetical protein
MRAPQSSPETGFAAPLKCYGIRIKKLDNPGAGGHFFVAEGGRALVNTPGVAEGMTQADAKSLILSTPFHTLLLTLDGVMESQVLKLW